MEKLVKGRSLAGIFNFRHGSSSEEGKSSSVGADKAPAEPGESASGPT